MGTAWLWRGTAAGPAAANCKPREFLDIASWLRAGFVWARPWLRRGTAAGHAVADCKPREFLEHRLLAARQFMWAPAPGIDPILLDIAS